MALHSEQIEKWMFYGRNRSLTKRERILIKKRGNYSYSSKEYKRQRNKRIRLKMNHDYDCFYNKQYIRWQF